MKLTAATRTLMISLVLAAVALCSSGVFPASMGAVSSAQEQPCSLLSVNPSIVTISALGGTGRIFVNTGQFCFWTATSTSSFITIITSAPQTGSGIVNFIVAANPGSARTGSIRVGFGANVKTVTVSQQGPPTIPLYRYWNPVLYNHFYTTDFGELGNGSNGYLFERIQCRVYATQAAGTVPLYRWFCALHDDLFLTTDPNEPGNDPGCYQFQGIECYVYPTQVAGTIPLYRYYNVESVDHFYTTNFKELRNGGLGWHIEGVQCYVFP